MSKLILPLRIVHDEADGALRIRCVGVLESGHPCEGAWNIPPADQQAEMNESMTEALGHVHLDHRRYWSGNQLLWRLAE